METQIKMSASGLKIKVVGIGSLGIKATNRMVESLLQGDEIIAIGASAFATSKSKASQKICICRKIRGTGTSGNIEIARNEAYASRDLIRMHLGTCDLVILIAGLGGGTGTGATPVITRLAKETGALVLVVVTLPFEREGRIRFLKARQGIHELKKLADCLVVISNDRLIELSRKRIFSLEAFLSADEVVDQVVRAIVEPIARQDLENAEYAEFKAMVTSGGFTILGFGESSSDRGATEAVTRALDNSLLEGSDFQRAKSVFICFFISHSLSDLEIEDACKMVRNRLTPETPVRAGIVITEEVLENVRALVFGIGIDMPEHLEGKMKYHPERRGPRESLFYDAEQTNIPAFLRKNPSNELVQYYFSGKERLDGRKQETD